MLRRPAFARSVFGNDFEKLDAGQVAYVTQLCSVTLKGAVGAIPAEVIRKAQRSPFTFEDSGPEIKVSFTLSIPDRATGEHTGPTQDTTLTFRQADGAWKIVDIHPLATKMRTTFQGLPQKPAYAPVFFMEGVVAGLLEAKMKAAESASGGKHARRPAPKPSAEAQRAVLLTTLDTLANQIELFRAREGRYPDFAKSGWSELLSGGYLKKPPVNPVNSRSEIASGGAGKADAGWHWDDASATLGASYFDESAESITPGRP